MNHLERNDMTLPTTASQTLTIRRPDDWHVHFRDGKALELTVPHIAATFGRAIVMPNLKPPVKSFLQAGEYRARILEAAGADSQFKPLMTIYLTDETSHQDIAYAKESGFVVAAKLYPAGATTNSQDGVTQIEKAYAAIEALQYYHMPLLVHGESTDPNVDIFDREAVFIEETLKKLLKDFPRLKIVMEHITTKNAVDFVTEAPDNVAATITAHHLLYNRNAIFQGGIRPHYYCLPVLKREEHRKALLRAATSGNPKFFLGSDSAPHSRGTKEAACGCAGCYTGAAALELYAEAFEQAGALDLLESFASLNGPNFYGLPLNEELITLVREDWTMPGSFAYLEDQYLFPLRANENMRWRILR